MYLNFYNLKKEPFNVTPDPEFLFLSQSHKDAMGSIIYGVGKKKGFIAITGEVGVGKTTILRSYLERISRQQLKIVYVFNANVSFKGLLDTIYQELDIDNETDDIFEMINQLQQILIEEYKHGRTVVLIVDEAQNMPIKTQENLRMLSNLETSTDKLIQIVLVGQPEFEDLLNLKELRQLKQRIAVRAKINSLTQEESMAYIQHRLTKSTIDDTQIFTRGALKLIINKAKGTPRVLNILCDNALITGYGYQKNPITSGIAREVISDFEGKRRFSLFRWGIATLLVLIIMLAGYIWVYPYKTIMLSQVKNYTFSLERSKNTIPVSTIVQKTTDSNVNTITVEGVTTTREDVDMDKHTLDAIEVSTQSQVKRDPSFLPSEEGGPGEVAKPNKVLLDSERLLNEESPGITKMTKDEESEAESLINKLENEKNALEKLKIKFQEVSRMNKLNNSSQA